MKHFKQILSVLLILALVLVAFSACANSEVGNVPQEGNTGDDPSSESTVKTETEVRSGWLLGGIPAYEGGELSSTTYNSGPGLMNDVNGITEEDTHMQIAFRTSPEDFDAYLQKLQEYGYTELFRGQIEENLHAEYEGGEKLIYIYYTANDRTTRIIYDKSGVSIADFAYSYTPAGDERTEIYQYGLYTVGGSLTTVNCGMSYVIKLADNSVVIIDGGHLYQASDKATDGFVEFLHEITGTQSGEPIRIASYFVTHAHNDHMTFMAKVLHKYHNEIELERVMFNFPSYQVKPGGYSIYYATWLKHIITTYYPNAIYKKLHTGEEFTLADMGVKVLYTHEDAVHYLNASNCTVGDFNCTSTVLELTIDGKSIMILGDTNTEAQDIMVRMYSEETFKQCNVVQIAHHCFNYLTTLYNWMEPEYALCPNSFGNANSAGDNLPKLREVTRHTGTKNVWYSGEGTYGFAVVDGEFTLIYERDGVIGGQYDGSGV